MIHPLDHLGAEIVARGSEHLWFFTDGWGDEEMLETIEVPTDPPEPLDIDWVSGATVDGVGVEAGVFESPVDDLPEDSRFGAVTRVTPAAGTDRVVVLMAAWNEHDPKARIEIAHRLTRRGIGSLILENPYYGIRRPRNRRGQPIRTVSDFFLMGIGAVAEGRALLATVRSEEMAPGISGYSMGGNVAALISSTMPFPVATAPLAASYSPAPVYLDGALRGGIDWNALGGEASAEIRLRETLQRISVLDRPAPRHTAAAVLVAAKSDGYVPREATRSLHAHWPGSELRWVGGGHASLLWFHKAALSKAIVDAFDRLERFAESSVTRTDED